MCNLAFLLPNVLRATTACMFYLSFDQLARHPPLYRGYFSTLRSPKSFEKHNELGLSYLFARLPLPSCSFSSLIFSHLLFSCVTLPTSAFFQLSILSEVSLLNFLRLYIYTSLYVWDTKLYPNYFFFPYSAACVDAMPRFSDWAQQRATEEKEKEAKTMSIAAGRRMSV